MSSTRLRRTAASLASLARPSSDAPGVRILTYHRVNDRHPEDRLTVTTRDFAEQMAYLAGSERVMALGEAFEALRDSRAAAESAVVVTFDDGYLDNFECALPLLEKHRVNASFFVVTGLLGTERVIDRYRDCCAFDRCMEWGHVRTLLELGHEVGAHGRTHRELADLEGSDLEHEVLGSALDLERETGRRPRFFCYPRGREKPAVRRAVQDSGFAAALTVYPGPNRAGCDPYALRRTEISGDDRFEDFRMKLRGGYDNWHRLVQGIARWAM